MDKIPKSGNANNEGDPTDDELADRVERFARPSYGPLGRFIARLRFAGQLIHPGLRDKYQSTQLRVQVEKIVVWIRSGGHRRG